MMIATHPYNPSSSSGASAAAGAGLGAILGPVGSIAGSLIGGLLGRSGQESANRANLAIAREQMAFQREMSSTAYQRSAADLEKAGLNRILALGKPASTPAGASAQMQNRNALMAQALQQSANTAMAAVRLRQEVKESESRIKLQDAQKWNYRASTSELAARTFLTDQKVQTEILNQVGINTQNKIAELDRQIRALRIPGMQAEADLWNWLSEANIDEIAKVIPGAGALVGSVLRMAIIYLRNPGASTPAGVGDRFRRGK